MAKPAPVKRPAARHMNRRATTVRLDPVLQEGLALLQGVDKKPLNRLVNEAIRDYLEKRGAAVEAELQQILSRVRAYRRADPNYQRAIAEFVAAEAALGAGDPVEGRAEPAAGPAQRMVQALLRG